MQKKSKEIKVPTTVFGLSVDVVTIFSITGAISNALKLTLA